MLDLLVNIWMSLVLNAVAFILTRHRFGFFCLFNLLYFCRFKFQQIYFWKSQAYGRLPRVSSNPTERVFCLAIKVKKNC